MDSLWSRACQAPTLENLRKALRSKVVGFGKTASQLDKDLDEHGIHFAWRQDSSWCMAPSGKTVGIEIASQTLDTEVADEKPTLLEVEAVSTCGDTISYQWVRNGCPLKDDGVYYLGSDRSILCITASLHTEGTYTCEVRSTLSESDTLVVSKPAVVRVSIPHCKKILVDMYSARSDDHKDVWPPPVSNSLYINLALVKQGGIDRGDAYSYATIQGDVDDVVYQKESIGYDEAFGRHRGGALLLIEGRPGCGEDDTSPQSE